VYKRQFFSDEIVDALDAAGIDMSISVPFECFVELKRMIEKRQRWQCTHTRGERNVLACQPLCLQPHPRPADESATPTALHESQTHCTVGVRTRRNGSPHDSATRRKTVYAIRETSFNILCRKGPQTARLADFSGPRGLKKSATLGFSVRQRCS